MTCIVGLVQDGVVYIGGDSAGLSGWRLSVRHDPKVFTVGEFVIGFTTSYRMGQLLAHAFYPPLPAPDQDLYAYMVTSFVDAVRQCFKDGGYASKTNETEKGGTFLVGFRGRLFMIDDDYQVGEPQCGYDAVGTGVDVALGVMFATKDEHDAVRRITCALEAAEYHNGGVRGPFVVEVA